MLSMNNTIHKFKILHMPKTMICEQEEPFLSFMQSTENIPTMHSLPSLVDALVVFHSQSPFLFRDSKKWEVVVFISFHILTCPKQGHNVAVSRNTLTQQQHAHVMQKQNPALSLTTRGFHLCSVDNYKVNVRYHEHSRGLWPWPFKVMNFANYICGHISVP